MLAGQSHSWNQSIASSTTTSHQQWWW